MRYKIGEMYTNGAILNVNLERMEKEWVDCIRQCTDEDARSKFRQIYLALMEEGTVSVEFPLLFTFMQRIVNEKLVVFEEHDIEKVTDLISAIHFIALRDYLSGYYGSDEIDSLSDILSLESGCGLLNDMLTSTSHYILLPISETVDVATNTIVKTAQKKVWSL